MKTFFLFILLCVVFSCKNDDDNTDPIIIDPELTDEVEVYNSDLLYNGLVLAIQNGSTSSYLINKEGHKLHEWAFDLNLGNDLELLPNGNVIGIFKTENPVFTFGGYGGVIRIIKPDNSVDWEYEYVSNNVIAHHDVELLPNGNILFLAWERMEMTVAQQSGINATADIFPESLIEVNPNTNQVVWEWHSWDHVVQDVDSTLPNYGAINDNPNRINFNYNLVDNGDIMHANGIDFDETNDLIFMSINGYSEVWVIDHSTTTAEAATSSGGNQGKGGNLVYRFGNPEAYNSLGERLFFNNHFPNVLENGQPGSGNVLIYVNNGNNILQSTVYEFDLPNTLSLSSNTNNEPTVVWSFTDENLYNGRISGADRLANGNTLICEGDYGFWEITPTGEIAWKYDGMGTTFWRGYGYNLNDEGVKNLGL